MTTSAQKIILIGGSAGSYNLIWDILHVLPREISSAICVVIHRNPNFDTQIEASLSRRLERNVISVVDKTEIRNNNIYFAPPGYHLLIEPDLTFSLDSSEPVNYSRPSIDVLFETTAEIYGKNCMAFLLSGANTDGGKGLMSIDANGGKIFVQDPEEAAIDTMPKYALEINPNAKILSKAAIIDFFRNLDQSYRNEKH